MKVMIITPNKIGHIGSGGDASRTLLVRHLGKYGCDVGCTTRYTVDNDNWDVIHGYGNEMLPWFHKVTEFPTILTLNGIRYSPSMSYYMLDKYFSPRFYRNRFIMKYANNIGMFTTLCQFYKESWVRDGIAEDKITVIPNMIDPDFNIEKKERTDEIVRLLFVGEKSHWRKLDDLLYALKHSKYDNDVSLTIVGRGWNDVVSVHQKHIHKMKIDYIPWINHNHMPFIYASHDILVQPYLFPVPVGRALLEAMQCGICCITTGNEYYSDILRHMKDGILIDECSADSLSEALTAVIEDASLRQKLGESAKKRVREICSPEVIVPQYLKIYGGVEK